MPNQADIQQTILNSQYKIGTLVNINYTRIQNGMLAVKEAYLQWFSLNLAGLVYQFDISDYTSNTTLVIYDRLNRLVGIPYGATVDPNFQAPNTTIVVDGGGGSVVIDLVINQGDEWPFPYAYTYDGQPDVSYLIPDGIGGLTGNGCSNMFYSLNAGVMLIYGNNAGDGTFEEDTYVRIEV